MPRFADWVTVDLFEEDGRIRKAVVRHADPQRAAAAAALLGTHHQKADAHGAIKTVVDTRRPLILSESPRDALLGVFFADKSPAIRELGLGSGICLPLLVAGRVQGIVTARRSDCDRRYAESDVPFFEELVKCAAVAFDEAVRHDRARANEEITLRIMQNSEDCIAFLTLDGRVISVNNQGRARFAAAGLTLAIGSAWAECFDSRDEGGVRAAVHAAAGGVPAKYQGRFRGGAGEPHWCEAVVTSINDAAGVPVQLLSVSRDVTQQKTAALALESSERRYRSMTNAMPQIAFTAGTDGKLDFVNDRWLQYTGLTLAQSARSGATAVAHPDDRERMKIAWRAAIGSGREYEVEGRLRRASDGAYRWHLMRAVAARDDDGSIVQWFGTGTDIDDQKLAETEIERARDEALHAATIKAQFLATMSHEIRTPMSGVVGMTELLLLTALSDEQREYAKVVRDSGQSLLRVINDILDYSKIDAGKLELEVVEFDVAQQLKSVTNLFGAQCAEKAVTLRSQSAAEVPEALLGDPGRLRQILVNLVGNAVKFTPDGGRVDVLVTAERDAGGRAAIRFRVTDTGIGMTPEVQRRLFEPFAQGDGSTTRKFGGTGLGLSICKQLVDLMGGTLGVESVAGQGASFWFAVQLAAGSRNRRASRANGAGRRGGAIAECCSPTITM